jgi:outer membrane receptor protein involved in Fe transport
MSRFAALIALATPLAAQTVTGSIEGRITDSSSAAVPGATIQARNLETGLARTTTTNATGYYQFTFLPVGEYEVTASAKGMGSSQRRQSVVLTAVRAADFQLRPATVESQVTVVAESSLIEVARGEVKSSVDERVIEDRPLPSRNFLSLIEQMAGFQSSGGYSGINNPTLSSGSYVSFNGTGSRSATFQIDGVNNDDSSEGINRQNVNVSAIKEVQVLTNAYSAEFGRAGGAVVLVQTKSGTNRWHGDAYNFLQNEKLNSNSFFNNALSRNPNGTLVAPRAPYRRNQFGWTVGGPLVKNRLFLFHSFEQTKLRQYSTVRRFIFLPTDRIQVGDCRLCLKPEEHPNLEADRTFLQGILDRFPKKAPNATSVCDRCFVEIRPSSFPDEDYSGKFDWNATQRDQFALRYQYSRQKRFPGELIPGETARQNNKQTNVGLTATHLFGVATWAEFRFGLGKRTTLVDISTGNTTPVVRISNPTPYTTTLLGNAGAFPINRRQADYQFNYTMSHVNGRHVLKGGIDARKQHLDDLADNFSRGFWTFGVFGVVNTPGRFEGWENFLRGYVTTYQKGYGNFATQNRLGEYNLFFLDDVKLRPTLTLNLGLRYERVLAPDEVNKKVAYNYGDFGGWEPRFGFAWTPARFKGRASVRGGFGVFHNRIFQSIFTQGGASLRSLPPFGVFRSFDPTFNVNDPSNGFAYTPSAPNFDPGRIDIARVAPDLGMPTVHQYNLTVDHQVGAHHTVSVGYNRTRGIGLLQNAILNRARFPIVSPNNGILYDKVDPDLSNTAPAEGFISQAQPRTNFRRPDARYGAVTYINNGSWSYYNALRVEVKRRWNNSFHWSAAYAWSKTIDTGSDVTAGNTLTEFDSARSLRGLSDFDQRHRLNLNYSYTLPWFAKGRGVARQALGGWRVSGNNTFASGNPFTVFAGYDVNADAVANDRPVLLNAALFGRSVDDGRQDPSTGRIISELQLPAAGFFPNRSTTQRERLFDPGGSGRGSLGRNVFFGKGLGTWDLALAKIFAIREGWTLNFRTEMYNVTNTPRWALPTRDLQSAVFGRISSTYNPQNFVGASRSDDTSRVMQLSLRLVF